jgi:integrase
LPVEDWPAWDRDAWTYATKAGDLLEAGGPASHWSPASRRKTSKGYGRFLAWLDAEGRLSPSCSPADRVTKEAVAAYLDHLRANNHGYTVLSRIQELNAAVRVMAPDQDWAWLRQLSSAVRSRTTPAKNKRRRIQPPHVLADLGTRLMARADSAGGLTPLQRAVLFRDGLIIALLAYRPLRISNLAAIVIGRHLVQQGAAYWLQFKAQEMKNRRSFEATVPAALLRSLERYLQHHRVVLLTGGNRRSPAQTEALWVSEAATPMALISIHNRIRRHTEAAFGIAVSPHLFRDSAATEIAIDGPGHVRAIMPLLGHSSLATSESHYNQARSLDASRRHVEIIANLKHRYEA